MKKQKIIVGSILEIKINNEFYCYAQVLGKAGYVFFNYRSVEKLSDLSVLIDAPILFILSVYNNAVTEGRWLKVGRLDIREDLKIQPMQFIRDPLNPEKFNLYDPNTGEITPTTREYAAGKECAAVWEAEHVESRIKDYFNGVPNIWVEQLKIK